MLTRRYVLASALTAPDILRFGFAPAYTRFVDAWVAAAALADILESGAWDRPEFHRRATVT